ncbi:oxidoreductase FAD/NAD(P)-binding domain protein (plasmid) [Spirosoma linguale DSM 74]|uniref:Oxidoreductase FAD/NAD(P)-binding domain protein n=2 Tax=Cytophagaceae TaxID=89373 RepID=D2QVL3_SPILD|nr:oxidoreductase FAD/NAD(P)-binding domain protein [Spirosoma linguale DSM 74]
MLLPALLLGGTSVTNAQSEHEQHHPQASAAPMSGTETAMSSGTTATDSGGAKGVIAGGAKGGIMAEMGEMMKEMGKVAPMALYPTLMQMPELVPEKRDAIRQASDAWISEGNALMASGLRKLSDAVQSRNQDLDVKRAATEEIRQGQRLLESGFSAQRALAENEDPRTLALQWFNREMRLTPTGQDDEPPGIGDLSWFHIITMLTLIMFATTMIWMYFQKMKRANALVEKLGGKSDETIPPSGGAKPDGSIAPALPSGGLAPAPKPEPVAAISPAPTSPTPFAKPDAAISPDTTPSKPNSFSGTLIVSEIFQETPNVKTFRLTDPGGGKLPFNYLPGQFITVAVTPNGIPLKRSYTIASSPTHRDYCEITVKQEEFGTVSRYLNTEVHTGELLQVTGPSGKFTFTETHAKSAVFIGGGVGLTPMMSAIRYLTDRSWKGEIYFFFSCKDEGNIIFREELLYLQKRYSNLHVFFVLSRQQGVASVDFISGHITKELLAERVPGIVSRMVHICGPKVMMDAVILMLEELKVPKENIMQEVFAGSPPVAKTPSLATDGPVKPPDGKEAEQPAASEVGEAAVTENGQPAVPETPANTAVITFAKSNKTALLTPDKTVLEASEDIGVNIDYSCRVGTCGICKVKLLSGNVTMAVQDALTDEDKAQQIILACQAKATAPVSVEA